MKIFKGLICGAVVSLGSIVRGDVIDDKATNNAKTDTLRDVTEELVETRGAEVFEWMALGSLMKSMYDTVKLYPELGLGCNVYEQTTEFTSYNILEYTGCEWVDVLGLPNVKSINQLNNDDNVGIISNLKLRLFENTFLPPEVLNVSTNGYAVIGSSPGSSRVPDLSGDLPPTELVSALGADLIPADDLSSIDYATFRKGKSTVCLKLQWTGFRDLANTADVLLQLDLCDDGEFTSRVKTAPTMPLVQIGVKSTCGGVYRAEYIDLSGQAIPDDVAYVIRPANYAYSILDPFMKFLKW